MEVAEAAPARHFLAAPVMLFIASDDLPQHVRLFFSAR
jgi:hypothetical protein